MRPPPRARVLCAQDTKNLLRQAVQANRHPAVGMWLVGNEANLDINRFVCEEESFCKFWDNVEDLFAVLNELCGVVEEEGYLCTSPLADSKLPRSRYQTTATSWEDFNAHVRLLDAATPHFHVWMVRARSPLCIRSRVSAQCAA